MRHSASKQHGHGHIGLASEIPTRTHEERLRQFVSEGHASDAHQLSRYTARRRRAILVATTIDLEARLTDAVLDMADKLIGGLFSRARNATRRRYAASAGDVGPANADVPRNDRGARCGAGR